METGFCTDYSGMHHDGKTKRNEVFFEEEK